MRKTSAVAPESWDNTTLHEDVREDAAGFSFYSRGTGGMADSLAREERLKFFPSVLSSASRRER
jgi:hypothetical protein